MATEIAAGSRRAPEPDLTLFPLLTSFEGRIKRRLWWLGIVVLLAAGALAEVVLAPMNETAERIGAAVVGVALFASSLAVCAKRWHDRSKSAWWSLIGFVPAVGALWLIVELGFLDGTRGRNRFGPDPDH